jgi:hypothetical protein
VRVRTFTQADTDTPADANFNLTVTC